MTGGPTEELYQSIEAMRDEMVSLLSDIIARPSVSPSAGGTGEWDRVEMVARRAKEMGLCDHERYDAPDPDAPSGVRPNLVVWLRRAEGGPPGGPRLLVVVHTDVVPPGNLADWTGDPFVARVEGGRVIGRGAEDNGQALVASLFAARALLDAGIRPPRDVGLVMVADEEVENERGIRHLVREGFFREDDLVLVADHGEPDGRLVEVSEKALAWVRVTTRGRQCHPSMPRRGVNAHRAGMRFATRVDAALHERFSEEDPLFDHPTSSFEPTRKEANVDNVNTVPGEDVLYFDCRLLPRYHPGDVLDEMRSVADEVEAETGATIELETVLLEEAAPPTPPDAPIVGMVMDAVREVCGNDPRPGGIGGGTCAAVLRRAGLEVAVWETVDNTAHSPDEFSVIDSMVSDCKVFATMFAR